MVETKFVYAFLPLYDNSGPEQVQSPLFLDVALQYAHLVYGMANSCIQFLLFPQPDGAFVHGRKSGSMRSYMVRYMSEEGTTKGLIFFT